MREEAYIIAKNLGVLPVVCDDDPGVCGFRKHLFTEVAGATAFDAIEVLVNSEKSGCD